MTVVFSRRAQDDLDDLFEFLANGASIAVARRYTDRLRDHCLSLATFPERGTRLDDLRPGLRTLGFRRQATVAFAIEGGRVTILCVLPRGRDVAAALAAPDET